MRLENRFLLEIRLSLGLGHRLSLLKSRYRVLVDLRPVETVLTGLVIGHKVVSFRLRDLSGLSVGE